MKNSSLNLRSLKALSALAVAVLGLQTARAATIPLTNPSFETNTSGTVFTTKVTTGYDVSGNNVAGWLNAGATNSDSGVDFAGDGGLVTQSGTVAAYAKAGDTGAYQISGYQMQSGDRLTLTWWAKSSAGSSSQSVSLKKASSASSAFSSLTNLATSTAALTQTGKAGAYTQYTLAYTATSADAGGLVAVSFMAAAPTAGKWATFDSFALSVVAAGGPIALSNPSFETNTSGTVFTTKVTTGYDVSGNNVAGWLNAGATNSDSGVDFAGDSGLVTQSGTVAAYAKAGDTGAYQISGYQMQSGDRLTLTWWAKSSAGSSSQSVSLKKAASASTAFSSLSNLATSTATLNQTGKTGAFTQYTLAYTATSADAGGFVAVSFMAAGPTAGKWATFDSFALSSAPGTGGTVSPANSTVSPATASIAANGTSTQVITVQARTSGNVNLTTGGAAVVFSRTGTGTLSGTTDVGNGTYRATLTSPTAAGSATVTATLNGTAVGTASGANRQCVVTFTAVPTASPANSTVSPATASIAANGSTTQVITVQARTSGNVNLTTGGATVVFAKTGTGTLSGTTDAGNGTYRATLTSPTSSGSATVTATLNGTAVGTASGANPQCVVTFTAAATPSPANSTITPATASIAANGSSTQVITVQARTSGNVNLTTGGAAVVFSRTGTGTLSGTTDAGNGTYRATLTSPTAAGSATVTATLNGTTVGTASGANRQCVVTFTAAGGVSPANSTLSPGIASLTANGGSTQVITVQARDASNTNITTGGATVVFSRSGTGTLSGTTNVGNGTYTATLTAPSAAGSATVTATLNGTAVGTAVSASQSVVTYFSANLGDPVPGLTSAQNTSFTQGQTAFEKVQDETTGLGPIFNNSGCSNCHNFPVTGGAGGSKVTRFGRTTGGVFDPLTSLGGSLLQDNSNTTDFETVPSSANVVILRATTPTFGLGLIEAIPDSVIQANAAKSNADGIVGKVALVTDPVTGTQRVGRFGWKAQAATLLTFTADAANNEVGMTNRIFPVGQAPNGNVSLYNRLNTVADPNDKVVSGKADVDRQTEFQRLLGPPPALPLTASAVAGKALFTQIRCDICHTPTLTTAASFTPVSDLTQTSIAALSNKSVPLYSDLLLHNMGSLADGVAQGAASPTQMRTPPLWGLRNSLPYLHDDRDVTVDAAIRHHAGDGLLSANRYIALTTAQRQQLLDFLDSL